MPISRPHLHVSLLAGVCALLACAGPDETPPPCEHTPRPARAVRVFAVGHKLTVTEAASYDSFEAAFRATVEREVAPHLADDRPNLLVLPEDVALTAALLGARGAEARAADTAAAALIALIGPWRSAYDHYRDAAPLAPLAKQILLAPTDATWRAFDGTFSGIARDHGVYVVASLNVGDVEVTEDASLAAALGDPDRPDGAPVYRVPDARIYNQAVVYGPDGAVLSRMRKVYLTDPEHGDLSLDGHLPERLGPVDLGGVSITSLISRDAWMPDAQERVALAGAEIVLQHEAFSTWAVPPDGHPWPSDNLKRSGWAAVQRLPELRLAAAPMLVGNFFDVPFDGQTFIAVKGAPSGEPRALLAQEPDTGWAAVAPWVAEDPAGTIDERRAALRAIGEALLPGGADEDGYLEGTVWVDLEIPADDGYPVVDDAAPGAEEPILGASAAVAPSGVGRQRSASPVALPGGGLAIAWEDTRFCTGQIVVARSDGGAAGFSPPVRVSPWDRPQHTPSLAALPDGNLVVAWQEVLGDGRAEIRVAASGDGGATWSRHATVDPDATVDAWKPSLTADPESGDLYLAFVDARGDDANRRVYLARSADGGDTWSEPRQVDARERPADSPDRTLTNQWSPQVVAGGGRVTVAYTHRERPDPAEQPSDDAYIVDSEDGGATFGAPHRLDEGGFPERLTSDVALAAGEDGWQVAFSTYRGRAADSEVALASTAVPTLRFAPDADPPRDQWSPSLAPLGGGAFALVWQDFRGGGNDIYLARIGPDGVGPALRVDDAGDSDAQGWRPRATAAPDGTLYVVWEDSRSGRAELRVARGTLPGGGQ